MEPLLDGGGGLKLPILAALPPFLLQSADAHTGADTGLVLHVPVLWSHDVARPLTVHDACTWFMIIMTVCRSKSKTLDSVPKSVADLPIWNYDGSSCYQVGRIC
jgi:hypothetical protein